MRSSMLLEVGARAGFAYDPAGWYWPVINQKFLA
jgi:hypothetical protein